MKKYTIIVFLIFSMLQSFSLFSGELEAPPTPKIEMPPTPGIIPPKQSQSKESQDQVSEPSNKKNIPIITPPPTVKLKVSPPKTEEEAFKRIKDYKIFRQILPPGAAPPNMEKKFFGKFLPKVKPYIENSQNESLEEIEQETVPSPYHENTAKRNIANSLKPKNIKDMKALQSNKIKSQKNQKKITMIHISEKLKQEILKKYTENYSIGNKRQSFSQTVLIKKKKLPSFKLAIFLTIIWVTMLSIIIFYRRNI